MQHVMSCVASAGSPESAACGMTIGAIEISVVPRG